MNWHDLLGLILMDFFANSPYDVEAEVDLSLKKQFLDLVVIRKREGTFHRPLPDGMTELVEFNLISFKSYQDTFEAWNLIELMSHYVSYRKKVSPSLKQLLPEEQFKLFGLSARFPSGMAKEVELRQVQNGVYDRVGDLKPFRLIVLNELGMEQQNAMLQLFSAKEHQLRYACQEYQQHSDDTSTLIRDLLKLYQQEGMKMAITMEEYRKQTRKEFRESLSKEEKKEIIEEAPVEVRLEGLAAEEVFKAFPREEIEKYIKRLDEKSAGSGDTGV